MTQNDAQEKLVFERTFAATPQQLWQAWTDPEQYAQWINPAPGLPADIHEFDVREGGKVRFDMPQPDGTKVPNEGVFHVLDPHTRLVTGDPDKTFLLEVEFIPEGDKTLLRVQATGIPPEYREPAVAGWNACFDKLENVIQGA